MRADTVPSATDKHQPCYWGHCDINLNLKLSDSDGFRIKLIFSLCILETIRHMNDTMERMPKQHFRAYAW